MKWLTTEDVEHFFQDKDYDIRKSHNARWIDQKCTPDVLSIVADCILDYCNDETDDNQSFTSGDIWHSPYTVDNVEMIFKKPNPNKNTAKHEYDKFFQQPMELFSYAGVLNKQKDGNKNRYSIINRDLLEYLSLSERNSLFFLYYYIQKVLADSGLSCLFNDFFSNQTTENFFNLKIGFKNFIISNTPINNRIEVYRIFTKVINPLAYIKNLKGTFRGRLSRFIITLDMLMYNRSNFRDIYSCKPKSVTRKEHENSNTRKISYIKYLSQKAKRFLRYFNVQYRAGKTELLEEGHLQDNATHIHHIFSEAEYPDISSFYENLIALTPTQHLNYAHPNGVTYLVSKDYQKLCLIAKASSIQDNLSSQEQQHIYDFGRFMFVLDTGLCSYVFATIPNGNYEEVIKQINLAYLMS